MRRRTFLACVVLCGLGALHGGFRASAAGTDGPAGVQITYLANEGFLLEAGETKVLVDALFGDGLREYQVVPAALRADLEAARGRFAGVDLILASHAHADHFDAAAVARHLRANPATMFLSTGEAVAALSEELGEQAEKLEILTIHPDKGKSALVELPGVSVRVLNLHHGRLPIQNLGLIIRLGDMHVLHVGDTSATAPDLQPYSDLLQAVDVWLLPDWLMGDPDWEAARKRSGHRTWLINMHLAAPTAPPAWFGSAGSRDARLARIHDALPDAWVPLEPLASRHYPPPDP